tara:strand:- start:307 stop:540 length:234 start_codon:yes stop_codon:yes gene_type:complete
MRLAAGGQQFEILAQRGGNNRPDVGPVLGHVARVQLKQAAADVGQRQGERAKRASFEEDEHSHDEFRKMVADGYIRY